LRLLRDDRPGDDLAPGTLKSIVVQAGLKE